MSVGDELRTKIEALAPGQTEDRASAVTLSDACHALEAKFSQALGLEVPKDLPERDELRARCLELVRAWVPLLDAKNLEALEWRVKDRKTPIDLKARKAELKRGRGKALPDRSRELAPYVEPPPLAGFEALGALYTEGRLLVGEWPEHGVHVDARSGVWLVYFHTLPAQNLDDEPPPDEMVAVHSDYLAQIDELRNGMSRIADELPIHGARMAIADALAARDKDFVEAMFEWETDAYRGRGVQRSLDGDGRGIVWAQYRDKRAVLVLVKL